MARAPLRIVEADPQGPDAAALLREAAIEARALYPELHDPDAPWPSNPPTPARGVYLVAYQQGEPAGMGAYRPLDRTTAEIRRMFVRCTGRRFGIARTILQELECRARSAGFRRLVLETGYRQRPAMELYESCGFTPIAPFGKYRSDPTSVCYEKTLLAER